MSLKESQNMPRKQDKETIFNSFDLKKGLIIALISSVLVGIGYIAKIEYFDKKTQAEQFVIENHKILYKQGSEKFQILQNVYREITNYLTSRYGLTPIEIKKDKVFDNFYKTKNEMLDYKKELEKYSFDTFILSIDNILNLMYSDMLIIETYKLSSHALEDKIGQILSEENIQKLSDIDVNMIKKILIAVDHDLDKFISLENELYFRLDPFSTQLVNGLEEDFNSNFRSFLGMKGLNKEQNLNKLIHDWKNYKYDDQTYPFIISSQRIYAAPNLKVEGEFFVSQNSFLKKQILLKFILSASSKIYGENFFQNLSEN
ncbi:hypothetical protein [Sulfurospirillum multivorans]|uniref:RelE domain-containing protein n=2 Tax=Sulfurospirillum multivorans TaxID=66821 RepID=A0AA86ALD8_SULMK|nr:hypothetical protein [Sulfurospirillum multivorans]AHJ11653.1 RelE domain-containing protein [Sulfurospirillum multivorans DSM 12446]QEH05153.1 RelE domain-containing protein [Sulfurospirillum multivorans]